MMPINELGTGRLGADGAFRAATGNLLDVHIGILKQGVAIARKLRTCVLGTHC